jgi:hypothetical protein
VEGSILARITPDHAVAAFKRYFPGLEGKVQAADIDGDGYYRGEEYRQEGEGLAEYLERNQKVLIEHKPELVLMAAYPDTWDLINLLLSGHPSADDVSAIFEKVNSAEGEERELAMAWLEKNQANSIASRCLAQMRKNTPRAARRADWEQLRSMDAKEVKAALAGLQDSAAPQTINEHQTELLDLFEDAVSSGDNEMSGLVITLLLGAGASEQINERLVELYALPETEREIKTAILQALSKADKKERIAFLLHVSSGTTQAPTLFQLGFTDKDNPEICALLKQMIEAKDTEAQNRIAALELYLGINGGLDKIENAGYLIKCLRYASDDKDDPLAGYIELKLSEAAFSEAAQRKVQFKRLGGDAQVELMRQAAAFRALLLGNNGSGTEYGSLEYDLLGKDCNIWGKQCLPDADAQKMKDSLFAVSRVGALDGLLAYMVACDGKPALWKAGRRAEMIFRNILQQLNANPENQQYIPGAEPGSYGIELFSRDHLFWAARCADEYGGNEGDCLVQKFDPADLMTRTEVSHVQRPLLWFEGSLVVETYHYRYMRALLGQAQDWLCNDPIDYEKGQDDLLRNPPPEFTLP